MERPQTILIWPVYFLSPTIGIGFALAGIQQLRRQALVFPPIDQAAKLPRGPALFIDPRALNELLQQPKLIVRVKDREIALQSRQFGMEIGRAHVGTPVTNAQFVSRILLET